jgi:hypothetical protein
MQKKKLNIWEEEHREASRIMKVGHYNFESVNAFMYLGVQLNIEG